MAYREALQDLYGVKHAVPTSSGTTALHAALFAVGVGAGDEVILSPLTDYGSVIGIFQLNAIPVFADVLPGGILMDPASVEARITPHTKAIMPIHLGGYMVDMLAVMKIARKHRLAVVEDCAQSHLARIGKRFSGTFGEVGAWSTNESKHMRSGEGGFLLTNRKSLGETADLFVDKCYHRVKGSPATPAFPALNVRLSDLNAALALAQLKRLPGWIEKRQAFADRFLSKIAGAKGIAPYPQPRGSRPSHWWTLFTFQEGVLGVDTLEFSRLVRMEGIPVSPVNQPMVLEWEVFRKLHADPDVFPTYRPGRLKKGSYSPDGYPNALAARSCVLALSTNQHNTLAEAEAAARAVRKVVGALLREQD